MTAEKVSEEIEALGSWLVGANPDAFPGVAVPVLWEMFRRMGEAGEWTS